MLSDIQQYIPQARSITHLANLLNIPRSTLRDYLVRAKLPTDDITKLKQSITTATPIATNQVSNIDKLIQIADIKQSMSKVHQQHEFIIERSNEPVIFISWSDQHIGSSGTNHQGLKAETLAIKQLREEDPSIILALNGDLIDGYFAGSKHSNNDQVLGIDEQRVFARWMLSELRPEIAISADHEAWSIDSNLEINFTKDWCEENGINYAQWQAKLIVKFDNELERTILVNHRYPSKTKANPVGHLMALHRDRGPAHVVTCGHYHSDPGAYWLKPVRQNEDPYIGLQSGTNKISDSFAMKIGDLVGSYGIPACILFPNGDMMPFDHYSTAVEFKRKWMIAI